MPNTFDVAESFSRYSSFNHLITNWNKSGNPGSDLLPSIGGLISAGAAIDTASQGYQAQNNRIAIGIPQGASRKFYFKFRLGSLSAKNIIWIYEAAGTQLTIATDSTGHLQVFRGVSTLLQTSAIALAATTVYDIALEITIDAAAGVVNMWVNTVQHLNFTGNTKRTSNAFVNVFSIGNNGGTDRWGSVLVYPATMTTIMAAHVNPYKVNTGGPRADFLRGGVDLGSNAAQISKTLSSVASFNQSNVLNARDNHTMDAVGSGTLLGACLYALVDNDGTTGTRQLALTVESGATDDVGASQPLTLPQFGYYGRDASVDPATAALWANLAALNAAKMGYKITV